MSGCCAHDAVERRERQLLWVVLTLNASMFVIEFMAGWIAHSTSLLADSLDMFADAVVYGISLYAVGRAVALKATRGALVIAFQISGGRRHWPILELSASTTTGRVGSSAASACASYSSLSSATT